VAGDMEKQKKIPYQAGERQILAVLPARLRAVLGNWRGWVNIVLLFLVLEIAVLSIEQARWINPQPSLTLVLVLSILILWLLVRSRLPGAVKHILALVGGVLVTMWQAYSLLPPLATTSKFQHLLDVLQSWWQATSTLVPGDEKILFAIFLTFLTWIIGYVSTWFVLRRHNAWVGVSLGAVVILVNLSNLPGSYYFFFGLYFLAAIFLITQTRIVRQHYLAGRSTGYTLRGLLYLTVSILIIVILAGCVSWITPEARIPQLQTMIATRTLWKRNIEESKLNLFDAIPAKQPLSTTSTHRDLPFEEEWHQGDRVDFIINSDRPSYWRMNMYDTYTSSGWVNSPTKEYLLEPKEPWVDIKTLSNRDTIRYTVTTDMKTDVHLTAGDFISSDMPTLVHVSAGEVMAVTTLRVLSPGERYTVTSSTSNTVIGKFSGADEDYPQYIVDNYLQLPPDFPESVRQLSENITRAAETPYDKVTAIDDYLSRFPYIEKIEAPPEGTDGVQYFLFTQKSGFCLYFASAMAVMLRSVDVPSRLVAGYLPGDPGEEVGQYILRDKHYHTWTQAYFTGYGWVDLEATPSSTNSPVAIIAPWVSGGAIESMPQWDIWQLYQAMLAQMGASSNITANVTKTAKFRLGPLPFADELGRALVIIFSGALILALLLVPLLALRSAFYRWLWHVDRAAIASRTYNNMCRLASMINLGPRPQQTPLEFAAALATVFPQEVKSLNHIVQAYLENRFGRREGKLGLFEEAEILKARCRVYDVLLQRLGITGKLFSSR
jgi:transglutaminase-like putative cysteine protease